MEKLNSFDISSIFLSHFLEKLLINSKTLVRRESYKHYRKHIFILNLNYYIYFFTIFSISYYLSSFKWI